MRKAVRKKPNKKARINDVPTVEVTVEYLEALRKEVGRHIDPDTAEVDWVYAQVLDPYGDARDLMALSLAIIWLTISANRSLNQASS